MNLLTTISLSPSILTDNIYIGANMSVIGDKLFLPRRGGVVIIGPGYRRFIKNSVFDEEYPTKKRKRK